jgi:hypothetical protein
MGGDPLLKVGVGGGEVEVVHGVVAIVEGSAGERGGERVGEGRCSEQEQKESLSLASPGGVVRGS